jgi:hypothetical protein
MWSDKENYTLLMWSDREDYTLLMWSYIVD